MTREVVLYLGWVWPFSVYRVCSNSLPPCIICSHFIKTDLGLIWPATEVHSQLLKLHTLNEKHAMQQSIDMPVVYRAILTRASILGMHTKVIKQSKHRELRYTKRKGKSPLLALNYCVGLILTLNYKTVWDQYPNYQNSSLLAPGPDFGGFHLTWHMLTGIDR